MTTTASESLLKLPAYTQDDGPLTAKQVAAIRKDAKKHPPKGKTLSSQDLFS